MIIKKNVIAALGFIAVAVGANAASAEVALMKCGASSGKGYYFDGQGWTNDGISNGKITLVSNANGAEGKFDI